MEMGWRGKREPTYTHLLKHERSSWVLEYSEYGRQERMEKLIFPTGWEWDVRRDFTGVLCSYFEKTSMNSSIRQKNDFVKDQGT